MSDISFRGTLRVGQILYADNPDICRNKWRKNPEPTSGKTSIRMNKQIAGELDQLCNTHSLVLLGLPGSFTTRVPIG